MTEDVGYDPSAIEAHWKARWAAGNLDATPTRHSTTVREKYYVLEYFPYPSGSGLSVGHVRNYVAGDVVARTQRMRGRDVLHPMGWDAFGLPAENRARVEGRHPADTTRQFAANYRRQLELVSCGYDWSRELFSSDPNYYRWTQWLFLLLYERGLAYRGSSRQWWCDECETVLANEQVTLDRDDPVCWRGHSSVSRREVAQWFFRITAYAERLLADLDELDWPEGIIAMQRHWIGRSRGAEIDFTVVGGTDAVTVFTTRPDTLYGVVAIVLAPEHPAVARLTTDDRQAEVAAYVAAAERRSDIDRQSEERAASGVFTGRHASHPLTAAPLPVWVADYVRPQFGTGAVMAVPAHDSRDAAFARAMGLPAVSVIEPAGYTGDASDEAGALRGVSQFAPHPPAPPPPRGEGEQEGNRIRGGGLEPLGGEAAAIGDGAYTGPGRMIDSGPYSGMDSLAGARVTYRLRDWSVGRQRFWGAPIPIVHCPTCGEVAVPEADLPVRLPDVAAVPAPGVDDLGRPVSPLAAIAEFAATACPACASPARRETDTMDDFACSSWYFLRFISPHHVDGPFDPEAVARWMPVDMYIGGAEHAVMHLLYTRFWTKVMHDAGLVPVSEPFPHLRNQGMILDETGQKMSKSRPDFVVTPDEAVRAHGADAVRAYELFIAPMEQDVVWQEDGIAGVSRWLRRVWRLAQARPAGPFAAVERRPAGAADEPLPLAAGTTDAPAADGAGRAIRRATHQTTHLVTAALDSFRFNVAVAHLMSFTNALAEADTAMVRLLPAGAPPPGWRAAWKAILHPPTSLAVIRYRPGRRG